MCRISQLLQGPKRESRRRAGDFIIERPERRKHVCHAFDMSMSFHHYDSLREKRDRAPAVRNDEANIRAAFERARVNEIHDRARGIENILDDKRWSVQLSMLRRLAVSGMNEHHRLAPVELVEHWIEQRIA